MRVNNICPFCGDFVSLRDETADYIVSGRGRFSVKQLLHHKCVKMQKEIALKEGGRNGKTSI